MSDVRLKQSLNKISQARTKVRVLRQGLSSVAETTAQRTAPGNARASVSGQRDQKRASNRQGSEETGNNSRNSIVGSSGGNSSSRKSGQMVPIKFPSTAAPNSSKNLSRAVSSYVRSSTGNLKRDPNARLFKLDMHEDKPPVAVGSSLSRMPATMTQSEQSIHTPYGPGIRYSGTEYLTTISTGAGENVTRGNCMFAIPISPQVIPDTRLSYAAQMYTRYIFKKVKFYYSGTAPATTAGSLMLFGDYDPSQNPMQSPGDSALRYAFTHSASEVSVWQSATAEINDNVYADMLYTDPDEELRWSIQGCFWILSTGALPASTELGKVIVEYEIDFAVPDYRGAISNPTSGSYTANLTAAAAGTPVFNVGSWTGASPPTGVYFCRITSDPTTTATVCVSPNAYAQGAPSFSLAKGMCLWMVRKANSDVRFLWTPDLYSLIDPSSVAMVYASALAATSSFNISIFAVQSVTND